MRAHGVRYVASSSAYEAVLRRRRPRPFQSSSQSVMLSRVIYVQVLAGGVMVESIKEISRTSHHDQFQILNGLQSRSEKAGTTRLHVASTPVAVDGIRPGPNHDRKRNGGPKRNEISTLCYATTWRGNLLCIKTHFAPTAHMGPLKSETK